jgi:hypothetical protein
MTISTPQGAQAPKRSDTDPMIKRLRAIGEHPKTPCLVGRAALNLANHRAKVSDRSEQTIGAPSPLKARLDAANESAQDRLTESDQILADLDERIRQKFDPVNPEPISVPPVPHDMHEQAPSLPPQELGIDDKK